MRGRLHRLRRIHAERLGVDQGDRLDPGLEGGFAGSLAALQVTALAAAQSLLPVSRLSFRVRHSRHEDFVIFDRVDDPARETPGPAASEDAAQLATAQRVRDDLADQRFELGEELLSQPWRLRS